MTNYLPPTAASDDGTARHTGHVKDDRDRAEINMSRVPVSGDLPGLLFTLGTVLIFYWGIPVVRTLFPAAIVAGCGIAAALHFIRHEEPAGTGLFRGLKGSSKDVAMLSSVLRSERAVQMNVAILRAFVRMRRIVATNKELGARMEKLRNSHAQTASVIEMLVQDIDQIKRDLQELKALPPESRKKIGLHLTESAGSRA